MSGVLLNGSLVADSILEEVAMSAQDFSPKPKLVIILVGEDPASLSYIKQKKKAAEKTGILYEDLKFEENITTEELIKKIEELNEDNSVHGILVQLPLPKHIEVPLVIRAINPKKDVDGFHAYNLGKMFISTEFENLVPCTPKGAIRLLEHYNIDIKGKDAVIVGASNIVGKPLAVMLLNRGATVTVCHKETKDLAAHTRNADILVSATGVAGLIKVDMVKDGAVILDIGFSRVNNKMVGDVDFENVKEKASYITPVPGGMGPMTVACLMENTVLAAKSLNNS